MNNPKLVFTAFFYCCFFPDIHKLNSNLIQVLAEHQCLSDDISQVNSKCMPIIPDSLKQENRTWRSLVFLLNETSV